MRKQRRILKKPADEEKAGSSGDSNSSGKQGEKTMGESPNDRRNRRTKRLEQITKSDSPIFTWKECGITLCLILEAKRQLLNEGKRIR